MTNTFESVVAWQKARMFIRRVYEVTRKFPEDEKFGLTSQFRRAAVSIGANIAEGYKRIGKDDKLRFYNYAQGSLEECRCYIFLAYDISYITQEELSVMLSEIEDTSRLLNSYSSAIVNKRKWEDL